MGMVEQGQRMGREGRGQDSSKQEADPFPMGSEPLTLQARLCCWHEADGRFNGSWDFGLNGHKMANVDSSTGEWTEIGPGSRWMKKMLEKNMDFTAFLYRTSQGDCKTWLEEFKSHRKEKLEPAGNWEDGVETQAGKGCHGVCNNLITMSSGADAHLFHQSLLSHPLLSHYLCVHCLLSVVLTGCHSLSLYFLNFSSF